MPDDKKPEFRKPEFRKMAASRPAAPAKPAVPFTPMDNKRTFDMRPKLGVEVKPVPEFSEKTAPGAYYEPGS